MSEPAVIAAPIPSLKQESIDRTMIIPRADALAMGEHPRDGHRHFMHLDFEHQPDFTLRPTACRVRPAKHVGIADAQDCEYFGAALLSHDAETFYSMLCAAADSITRLPANPGVNL